MKKIINVVGAAVIGIAVGVACSSGAATGPAANTMPTGADGANPCGAAANPCAPAANPCGAATPAATGGAAYGGAGYGGAAAGGAAYGGAAYGK